MMNSVRGVGLFGGFDHGEKHNEWCLGDDRVWEVCGHMNECAGA